MFEIILIISLLILGYIFGRWAESKHYQSIVKREDEFRQQVPIFSTKHPPKTDTPIKTHIVGGNVVVSVDYFKRFVAALRMLVGGRLTSYESLVDRARREAILRMREKAIKMGASSVFNVKLETASISKGNKDSIGSVEVYAYGTAIIPAEILGDPS